jgi:hypothetical protein
MIYLILLVISIILFAWLFGHEMGWGGTFDTGFAFAGGALGVMVALIVSLIMTLVLDSTAHYTYQKTNETKIIALQDNGSVTGSFFLGSGYVKGNMQYVYMTENGAEMKMYHVDADYASLIYANEPKVETFEAHYSNSFVAFLFGQPVFDHSKYKIYVPKGTVKQNFNVDLQS